MPDLPGSYLVDPRLLARLFRDRTNSYKYLFFLSLLDLVAAPRFDAASGRVPLREVVAGMLARAYHPVRTFRLSLGRQDKLAGILEAFEARRGALGTSLTQAGFGQLCASLADAADHEALLLTRYVPTRLLRPFFRADVQGLADARVDRALQGLARERFDDRAPLYRLEGDALVLHPLWIEYLRGNHAVVQEWALWEWLQYLQGHNPSAPALAAKVLPVRERASLAAKTRYWNDLVASRPTPCLYTGARLEPGAFDLDHYLPWSFVGHDRLWNLVPATKQANGDKSDQLPPRKFLEGLVRLQAAGLAHARETLGDSSFDRVTEPFLEDLRLEKRDLELPAGGRLEERLGSAYAGLVPPLWDLARAHGFVEWSVTP